MERKRCSFRWLTLLVIGYISIISANASSVNIQGLTPCALVEDIPTFCVQSSTITVSSSAGEFDYVIVDNEQLAYNSSSYWTSYSINVEPYLDGSLHLLQLKHGGSDYGRCFIGNINSLSDLYKESDGIFYLIQSHADAASVITSSSDIEEANILSTIIKDEVEYPVTTIFPSAFANRENLHSVNIPAGISTIGEAAFDGCSSLTSLTFNATNCTSCGSPSRPAFPSTISTLTFGDGVTQIPAYFLYNGSQIESVSVPNAVTTIGEYAFYNSKNLKSLTLGSGLLSIGNRAFSYKSGSNYYNTQIAKVFWFGNTPPSNNSAVTALVNYVANDQYSLSHQVKYQFLSSKFLVDGTYYVPVSPSERTCDVIDCDYKLTDGNVVISDKVTNRGVELTVLNINDYSYYKNSSIVSVSLPGTLTSIGVSAFRNSTQLTSIDIPNAVTTIGEYAFDGCSSLTSLTFNATNCTSCGSPSRPAFPSTISTLTFGDGVTQIPAYFLYNGSQIESVSVPNAVTTIGEYAFYNSKNLKSLTLGSGLLSIGNRAFSYKSGSNYYNTQIAKVFWFGNTPPSNNSAVTALVNYVANDQYSLSHQVKYQFLSSKFLVDGTYYVPVSPSERTCDVIDCDYKLTDGNVVISDKVTNRGVELTVLNINDYSYYKNSSIESLTTSNKGNLGHYAFYYCNGLTSVVTNNKGYIGSSAFASCEDLNDVQVTSNGNIQDGAFYGCKSLKTASINNVGSIGNESFYGCTNLNNITLGNSVLEIGSKAFYECTNLNNITLGNSVSKIGSEAFYSCSTLPTISLPNNVSSIGEYIFYGCSKLATVTIGRGISLIPHYSFANCSVLNNLTIPNNVKSIGDYVFSGCRALANLTLEDNEIEEEVPEAPTTQYFDDWVSTNHGDSSTSYKEYALHVEVGDKLSFNYEVDSESGYDYLIIKINDVEVVKESGNKTGSYNKTFLEAGDVKLYLSYTKDNSQSNGQDKASVSNITLNSKGFEIDNLQLGSNGTNPLFYDCPLDVVYIGRKLSYSTASNKGYSPFYRNTSLHSVEVTNAETQIYDNEFYGCTNLKTLKVGNGVKTIGKWAFSGCSSLDYFSSGYHVESIGEEAFSDCTGLTSYYSFSIEPPVCGNQALDDINKWDCTLFVPAESSDEYMAADQWKDFFFVNENDAVLIESIRFNVESLDGKTGDTFQLVADVLPRNATRKRVEWSSSDPSLVTVDASGLVTFVKEGYATITVRATDGSGVESTIDVVVTVKEPELGDSNANGVVNIADAVNTANYAIGNEVEHFNETAADVNRDGIISLADASATVTLILDQAVQASAIAKVRELASDKNDESDSLIIDDYSAKIGDTTSVLVALDNTLDYVALQADVTVPDRMTLAAINIGNRAEGNHSLAVKRIDDRTMRFALFDINNSTFTNNDEAILELIFKVNGSTNDRIEINNIFASDAQAHEYVLTSTGGNNADMSGIANVGYSNIRIEGTPYAINIYNAEGSEIAVYAVDGSLLSHFVASSGLESLKVVPGMYVVTAGNKVEKVMVK